jgi:hypothetical protein
MVRRMADGRFRDEQWEGRYDAHIAPINHLVDALQAESANAQVPYVAPMYGGGQWKAVEYSARSRSNDSIRGGKRFFVYGK